MPDRTQQPQIHVITGLPRAGTTLLQDLLNQNPAFHVSSTSPVADTLRGVANFWSASAEVRSEIHAGNEGRMVTALDGLVRGWYADHDQKAAIFDKGRPWMAMVDRFRQLYPHGLMFCCVRDPRMVFASILKHHARFPLLDEMPGATVLERADRMFAAADGLVGGPLTHIEDQISRQSKTVVPIVFERIVEDPERVLRLLYAELKMDYFPHQFDMVEGTSTDLDVQYAGGKYPHHYEPRPVAPPTTDWRQSVPPIVADLIIKRYPTYARLFGYG